MIEVLEFSYIDEISIPKVYFNLCSKFSLYDNQNVWLAKSSVSDMFTTNWDRWGQGIKLIFSPLIFSPVMITKGNEKLWNHLVPWPHAVIGIPAMGRIYVIIPLGFPDHINCITFSTPKGYSKWPGKRNSWLKVPANQHWCRSSPCKKSIIWNDTFTCTGKKDTQTQKKS